MADLYAKIIYPSIFNKEYIPMSEYGMEDEIEAEKDEPLDSDEDTLDISNQ